MGKDNWPSSVERDSATLNNEGREGECRWNPCDPLKQLLGTCLSKVVTQVLKISLMVTPKCPGC